jgi:phage shock protein PspC (stress-responsive transcriptional regulator)
MLQAVYSLRYFLEKRGFYVSSRLADRLGMRAKSVRLFFIYVSFATLGAGFAIYLTMAFVLKLKDLVNTKRTSVFDL